MRTSKTPYALSSPLGNQRGVTLMIVLVAVVITGLAAGIAGSSWQTVMQRERERELLWRGDQYRRAIESYYKSAKGGVRAQLPPGLEDLLQDSRFPGTKKHIRRLYKDPFTGEDFELIRAGGDITGLPGTAQKVGGITGVRSTSDKKPFKQDGFSTPYESFSRARIYRDWEFVYVPAKVRNPAPNQPSLKTPPNPPPAVSLPETNGNAAN